MGKNNNSYPAFSVLMSVYKNENPEYLDLALHSIEKQTVIPNEIVLVEDGPISKELKAVIIKHQRSFVNSFKDIVSSKCQGLGAALRLGTKYITTEWIARMDSDDFSVPERFEKQLNCVKKDPKLVLVGGQVNEFSVSLSNIVGRRGVPFTQDMIYSFAKWRSPFNHPTVLINKNALERVGGYIPFGNLEDYYLWSRIIANKYPVTNLPDDLVYMRVDEGMYRRRGRTSNLKYIFRLRQYLKSKGYLSFNEWLIGNALVTANILMPNWLRKTIYQKVLHKKGKSL